MKKIFNWSFGAFFRTIGRVFGYLVIGVLIMLIFSKFGFNPFFMTVKAATSGLDKYDDRFWPVSCNAQGTNCTLGPGTEFLQSETWYNIPTMYSSIMQFNVRTWAGSYTYKANNTYTFRYTVQVGNKATLLDNLEQINKSVKLIETYTATSSSPNNATIEDLNVSIKFTNSPNTTDKIYLYIKMIPTKDIKWWGIKFQVGKAGGDITQFPFSNVGKIRYINSKVTYEEGVGAIIDNKTDEIIKEQEKTNEILSKDHNYNTNPSESTENEKQQMENYEQEEDSLRNGLDLSIEESEITIKPEANTFIWEVVNKLRGMSSKIVLLFTSVLSLGIMKMILGR